MPVVLLSSCIQSLRIQTAASPDPVRNLPGMPICDMFPRPPSGKGHGHMTMMPFRYCLTMSCAMALFHPAGLCIPYLVHKSPVGTSGQTSTPWYKCQCQAQRGRNDPKGAERPGKQLQVVPQDAVGTLHYICTAQHLHYITRSNVASDPQNQVHTAELLYLARACVHVHNNYPQRHAMLYNVSRKVLHKIRSPQ